MILRAITGPIRDAPELLLSIADHLESLGLEPKIRSDASSGMLGGRLLRIELEDVKSRLEQCQVSGGEAALLACPSAHPPKAFPAPWRRRRGVPGLPGALTAIRASGPIRKRLLRITEEEAAALIRRDWMKPDGMLVSVVKARSWA